jgi:TolA-binding protein
MKWDLHSLRVCRLVPLVAWLALGAHGLYAASFPETNDFAVAKKHFDERFWSLAETEFGEFARKYTTNSQFYYPAILFQAEARFNQSRYTGVIDLLSTNQARAGGLADQFLFWIAQAQFAGSNYSAAAGTFGRLLRDYPAFDRRLEAAFGQAEARSKLEDWPLVVEALGQPNAAFQQAARSAPTNEVVVRGLLLLSEAEFALKDYAASEATLRKLGDQKLPPESEWGRSYLLGRVQLEAGRGDEALTTSTNLLAVATETRRASLQARSIALQAEILERLDRLPEAVQIYERNLDKLPPERRRQAVLRIVELNLRQGQFETAAKELEEFLAANPDEKTSDLALLTIGEIDLRRYREAVAAGPAGGVSAEAAALLQQAAANFTRLIATFTNSPLLGKAQLNLGWCLLAQDKIVESEAAFGKAVDNLPPSEDQAIARFKLADVQSQRDNPGGAISNYSLVIDQYPRYPAVTNTLFEPALYQLVRLGLEQTNQALANGAMEKLLAWFPNGPLVAPGMLLVGQGFSREGDAEKARNDLSAFGGRFPDSPLLPEVELAIARTYEVQSDWLTAIRLYETWLDTHTNHPSIPRAQFACAWANFAAGRETNALSLYTNFLAQFPTNALAPMAQYWIADHYWRTEEFDKAERNYEEVFRNKSWPTTRLTDQALMMAGRAAMARDGLSDATNYFTTLLAGRTNVLPALALEARFALSDALMRLTNYNDALRVLGIITNTCPSNSMGLLAVGRMGDCYFQLAGMDPAHNPYDLAITNYQIVVDSPLADISARSQAAMGIALCQLAIARALPPDAQGAALQGALRGFLDIVHGKNLRAGEKRDLFWVREAGIAGGKLAEEQGQLEAARQLYADLRDLLTSTAPTWDRKIEALDQKILKTRVRAGGEND